MDIKSVCSSLRKGQQKLALQNAKQKNIALEAAVKSIEKNRQEILEANKIDVENARKNGMSEALVDRLSLDDKKINGIISSIELVIAQTDPIGEETAGWTTPNGLSIRQVRVPVGVVAIIYESRPNVTADAFCLAYKSGNSILLRGSSSAINSNQAIVKAIKEGLSSSDAQGFGVPEAIELAPCKDHDEVKEILTAVGQIDLALPRGSAKLIKTVVETAKVPVIETGSGVCHLYVDEDADLEMAATIAENGKIQRPGVCNALECIVVNKNIAEVFLPKLVEKFADRVVFHADDLAFEIMSCHCKQTNDSCHCEEANDSCHRQQTNDSRHYQQTNDSRHCEEANDSRHYQQNNDPCHCEEANGQRSNLFHATEEDFGFEYLDYACCIKTVDNIEEAVEYINSHNTKHSESIITNNRSHARYFQSSVDASCVYVNASTRFTDGGEFGFGTELGISTQKLHARGPMGIKALTTTKYLIDGDGQIR